MKVILQESIPTLGDVGEIVKVADGYGRNFLLPRGLARLANEKNMAEFNHLKKLADAKIAKVKADSEEVKKKLEEMSLNLQRKVGEHDKLFGSVTSMDIATALKEKGFELDRRQIQLEAPIKKLGIYEVPVRLNGGVEATLKVWLAAQEEEGSA
jgi:large subunit ribosomal protein L9